MGDPVHDAVVVGSGAGGAPVALALAREGFSVLVLEKGRRYSSDQFVHDEIATVRRDFFVPSVADDPHVLVREGEPKGNRSTFGWIATCVGGGTVHMAGHFYRLHPVDFRMASEFGRSREIPLADWPLRYEDLEPWYALAEREIGVAGSAGANPFDPPRSGEYPLPPVETHPAGAWIDDACAALGLHAFREARAILSRPYRERAACLYCDFCGSYGCEAGAKSSTLSSLVPDAEATGKCKVVERAAVFRIEVAPDGRATGCLYRDARGETHRIRARIVVLACSAIETARLLLLSKTPAFPDGLANSSGQVGRNLQFSSFTTGSGVFELASLDDARRDTILERHPFLGRSVQDFYRLPPGVSDLDKGGTLRFGFPHPNPIFRAIQLAHRGGWLAWGMELKERMEEHWHRTRTIEFETFADFLPNPGTYVDLDPDTNDARGEPAARIHLAVPEHHARAGRFLQEKGLEILDKAGAHRLDRGETAGTTGHLVHGTCRAGTDPRDSVLDPEGRAHDVPNLYVTDGAYFPTAGGVATTLTILANSFRIADRILERARRGDFR
ncbi:MAG: GMC family oxidoreductase [Planctomycetes bacterium]|nr:GMC family oxidoreductase [Planctomycetota bacterium]